MVRGEEKEVDGKFWGRSFFFIFAVEEEHHLVLDLV
jgi:hypothetical protein